MTEMRRVTDNFYVAPQISVEDVPGIVANGFTLVINNRPDGEAPGQPTSAEIQAACTANKMYYFHIPVVGVPTRREGAAIREALDAGGTILAFCRSGTRSINAWALGEALDGTPHDLIIAFADKAGYDVRAIVASTV